MRVTFFRPPSIIESLKPMVPFGIGYMSAVLKRHRYETTLVDGETFHHNYFSSKSGVLTTMISYLQPSLFNKKIQTLREMLMNDEGHDYWNQIAQNIVSTEPEIIAISSMSQQITAVNIVTKHLKNILPKIPIVLGGVHATALPNETMLELPAIDYIIAGEGEYRLLQLCECIRKNELDKISYIDSLFSRDNGAVRGKYTAAFIENLDKLPFPDRTLGKSKDYRLSSLNSIPIVPGRGCPYNCTFCASNIVWKRRARFRTAENVIAEIMEIAEQTGSNRFAFVVDTMITNKQTFFKFCELIQQVNNRKFAFSMNSRVNEVDDEVFEAMRKSGIDSIAFGIESGSQQILDRINKNISIFQIKKAIELVQKYNIFCTCNFMIGHPGETEEDVRQTVSLAQKIANKHVNLEINLATPYPGTQLYDLGKERGYTFSTNSYYKLYHQGKVVVNLTDMNDQCLIYWYKKIQKLFERHSMLAKLYRIQKRLMGK